MDRDSQARFDVLVIGGGPAGIAAAVRAAESGVRVGIVDDNPTFGGQIWRGEFESGHDQNAARWGDLPARSLRSRGYAGRECFTSRKRASLLAEASDGRSRIALPESRAGNRSAGAVSPVSRLDFAERDGSRRLAGNGQVWITDSRQARSRRRNGSVVARGGGIPA